MSTAHMFERDKHGYLKHYEDWSHDWVTLAAAEENIDLTDEHWVIINLVREFYAQFQTSPAIRVLVKLVKKQLGEDKNSLYLQQLFPNGPAKQATKLAGLPKPARCT